MSDSFEFTLHNPLSKEDWDKLTDVELEKTEHIWFETPSGKKVDYIPAKVLDKIRADLEDYIIHSPYIKSLMDCCRLRDDVMRIIDKYKAESEE